MSETHVTHDCKACPKRFYLASLLNSHVKNVHEKPKYLCEYCEKSLSSRVTQRAHQWDCPSNPRVFTQDDMDRQMADARKEWERGRKRTREETVHMDLTANRTDRIEKAIQRSSLAISQGLIHHHT